MTFRIEIAGGIAAGKSTLCNALEKRGFPIIRENLDENFCLSRAYANKASRGFDVQMAFLISKASAIETWAGSEPAVICDYALVTEYAYTNMHLAREDEQAAAICRDAIDLRRKQIGAPQLFIYLDIPVQEQLRRIKARGRDFEQGIEASYLKALNHEIRQSVEDAGKKGELGHLIAVDVSRTDITSAEFLDRIIACVPQLPDKKPEPAPAP